MMERNSDDHEGGKLNAQLLFFIHVKREPAPNTCCLGCERLDQCKRQPRCEQDAIRKGTHHD